MKQIFDTREAAKYLGVSYSTMKYYIFYAKNIKGEKMGNSLVFTRDQLDEFKANRRPQVGQDHCAAKVTEDDVRSIRSMYASKEYTQKQIGHQFGISDQNVSAIVNYKTWKHV